MLVHDAEDDVYLVKFNSVLKLNKVYCNSSSILPSHRIGPNGEGGDRCGFSGISN